MILVFCFRASKAVIWKDRRDPSGNMAFACLCGAPSLIVIRKRSNAQFNIWFVFDCSLSANKFTRNAQGRGKELL